MGAQTLVELLAELAYIKLVPRLIGPATGDRIGLHVNRARVVVRGLFGPVPQMIRGRYYG